MKPDNNKRLIKAWSVILYCALSLSITACSSEADCFVADNVTKIKTVKVGETEYSIYLRVSGFQEKEAFYELYDKSPVFDVCGKASLASIANVHVDDTKGTAIALVLVNQELTLEYDSDGRAQSELTKIPVTVKAKN